MANKALEAKRAKNHSPAIERKRTENAYHTNPLAPIPAKVLRKQAQALMRSLYKPAFKQLGNEESRLNSISEKRKSDNSYYLNWLNQNSETLQAHDDLARSQVQAAGVAAQQEVQQGWDDLRDKLVTTGESTPGVVSNVGDANAYDVSSAAAKSTQAIDAQRANIEGQQVSSGNAAALGSANNFAIMAASEAKRVSDQWEGLSKLGDAKQQLRLTRASEAAKEVARLMDKEVEKSQIRGQLSASEATAEIEAKRFGLDKAKLGLEGKEFDFEKYNTGRKYGLESQKVDNEGKKIANEGAAAGRKAREAGRKANHQTTALIREGISTIAHNPNLISKAEQNPDAVKRQLAKVLGSQLAAEAAYEVWKTGGVSGSLRKEFAQIGYTPPKAWS